MLYIFKIIIKRLREYDLRIYLEIVICIYILCYVMSIYLEIILLRLL
jgi:hypothetical protein